jgi:hypothetical protein
VTYVVVVVMMVCFAVALRLSGIVPLASGVIASSRSAARVMRHDALSDMEKERAIRRHALGLLGTCWSITSRGVIAVLASLVPLLAFDRSGLAQASSVTHVLGTWQGVVLGSVVMALILSVGTKH